ncbi:MAG: metal-dependent transcriptional regulator [Oscillospiraceae bacterium]|nr:metal-dependent transcriptional regulator [Oscillospiraceae bacterium]
MLALSWSEKNYMEALYILKRRLGLVRCVDVAQYMEHSKPSVSKAVSLLRDKGYLEKIDHALVFTALGFRIAEQIAARHCILTHALKEMGIDEVTAVKDAQNMERVLSEEAISRTAAALQCQERTAGICPFYAAAEVLAYG